MNSAETMKRTPHNEDARLDSDAVWDLLDHASPASVSPRFADDVMRSIRLEKTAKPWWQRVSLPLSLAGLTAATAALVMAFHVFSPLSSEPDQAPSPVAEASYDGIQEEADSEVLVAAVDHLDRYSDKELISMIGL